MNALAPIKSDIHQASISALHVAAAAMAYPVADGSITYSDAVAAIARTAIRIGYVNSEMSDFEVLQADLEATISKTILAIENKAARDVRRIIALCRARRAPAIILREAALITNEVHGSPLPAPTIDFLIEESAHV